MKRAFVENRNENRQWLEERLRTLLQALQANKKTPKLRKRSQKTLSPFETILRQAISEGVKGERVARLLDGAGVPVPANWEKIN